MQENRLYLLWNVQVMALTHWLETLPCSVLYLLFPEQSQSSLNNLWDLTFQADISAVIWTF